MSYAQDRLWFSTFYIVQSARVVNVVSAEMLNETLSEELGALHWTENFCSEPYNGFRLNFQIPILLWIAPKTP